MVLKHYELGIEDSAMRDAGAKQNLEEEQRRKGRLLTVDEQIEVLKAEYLQLKRVEGVLMEDGTEYTSFEKENHHEFQKVIESSELEQHILDKWNYVAQLQDGRIVVKR